VQVITGSDPLNAAEVVGQNPTVNESRFNPLQRTSRVTLFAVNIVAATEVRANFAIGSVSHADDAVVPLNTGGLSTRDHVITSGHGMKGDKLVLGYRAVTGTPTFNFAIWIEPL